MSNGSYMPRQRGIDGWDTRWDDFNDVADHGLSDTDAARSVFTVRKEPRPDGLLISYVDNDNARRSYVVDWPELIALAGGQNPSDPRLNAGQGWRMVNSEGRVFPTFIPPGAPNSPVMVEIERGEAYALVQKFRNVWTRIPAAVQMAQAVSAIPGVRI